MKFKKPLPSVSKGQYGFSGPRDLPARTNGCRQGRRTTAGCRPPRTRTRSAPFWATGRRVALCSLRVRPAGPYGKRMANVRRRAISLSYFDNGVPSKVSIMGRPAVLHGSDPPSDINGTNDGKKLYHRPPFNASNGGKTCNKRRRNA